MAEVPTMLDDLKDDDLLVIFRIPPDYPRRKSSRIEWGTIKKAVLAAQPTVKGPPGKDGAPGRDGAQGPVGAAGLKGDVGPVGPQGAKGDAGPSGAIGPKGDIGPAGPTGATGATGAIGLQGPAGAVGGKGDTGAAGPTGATGAQGPAGATGAAGAPKRIERYTGAVVGSLGIATITFPTAFAAPPLGQVVTTWDGAQMITGQVTGTTTTTATVKVMKSAATFLLNASPFVVAPAGQVVTIDVLGN